MNREETERYINVVVTTNYWKGERGAEIMFMYPALYRTSCQLDIRWGFTLNQVCHIRREPWFWLSFLFRFFPYDQQNCTLVISSWTSSKSDIDYRAEFETVNLDNFIPNEEWVVVSFEIVRVEVGSIYWESETEKKKDREWKKVEERKIQRCMTRMISSFTITNFSGEVRMLSGTVGAFACESGGAEEAIVLHRQPCHPHFSHHNGCSHG